MKRQIAVVVVIFALITATACTQGQLRRALILFRDFAVGLDKAKDALDIAVKDGELSQADLDQHIKPYFAQLADANDEAIGAVLVLKSKPKALRAAAKAIEALDNLNSKGVLHIKNEQKRLAVQIALSSLRTALATAQALLQ